ncbi:MAG: flavin prenyltransferase UbiX [Desulfuromonadia bacterium]
MTIILAITGASGTIYGIQLLRRLVEADVAVTLIASRTGREVSLHETGIDPTSPPALRSLLGGGADQVTIRSNDDLFAPEASGSHPVGGMVIAPCSMGTIGRITHGISSTLIERGADVMLKERRPLILVPRESPLSVIHLENLLTLARGGGVILPAMPAFYQKPETIGDLADFVAGKVMDQLGIPHTLFPRWGMESD